MMDSKKAQTLQLLEDVLKKAKGFGATDADVILSDAASVSVNRRLGKPESVTRSEESEIGLRVFVGKRQAIVSSSDRSEDAILQMAERAVAMAKCVPDDAYVGIADPAELAQHFPDLDLFDATTPDMDAMAALTDTCEQAALAVKRVTNSEGAECAYGTDLSYFAASNGFIGSYASSGFSLSASVIAGDDSGMETDYAYDSTTFFKDLRAADLIGREAGERAAKALSSRKGPTGKFPVIFDQRISPSIPGALANAISGAAVAKNTTMFKDMMGKQVMARGITITDDPFMKRGAKSMPFDDEGIAPQKRDMVKDGVLQGWFLDLASARQLGLNSTGNAARSASSPPHPRPSNLYLHAGALSVEDLIADIGQGFFVTQFLGSGGSILTGDYSRGARGFWIENGQIAYPVSEMTIAGNLKEMFLNLTAANDLDIRYGTDAPTVRIEGMMIA